MSRTRSLQHSRRSSTPKISRHTTDVTTSPYRLAIDSPSRQLQWELQQLAISSQKQFSAQLDREDDEREVLHREALTEASARHDRIRHEAEQLREQLEQQVQAERRRREEEAQKENERLRREREEQAIAAKKRQESERARTAELEAKRAAEVKRTEKEAAERRKKDQERRDAEAAQKLKEEQAAEIRRKDEARAAEARAKQSTVTSQRAQTAPTTKVSTQPAHQVTQLPQSIPLNPQWEEEHQRYLTIHQRLKELRNGMASQAKQNPELKQAMGHMRREIKKSVGQLREGKGANSNQLKNIMDILKKAATLAEPSVDVTLYLASPPRQVNDPKGPALLVYLLSIFAKAIVAQFVDEAGVKPQIADPIGTVASHIFAISDLRWKEISLVDILIAKFHVVCPVLFGIYGDEQSVQGKQRLGWSKEEDGGPFVPQQRHFERMTGLGAGFAGISLKNYEKARAKNPYPDHHYWQAIARIASVPSDQITQTHLVVLKGMIEWYAVKFLRFFGDAALAALRYVLVELPKRSPPSIAAKALAGLVDVLKREKKLVL